MISELRCQGEVFPVVTANKAIFEWRCDSLHRRFALTIGNEEQAKTFYTDGERFVEVDLFGFKKGKYFYTVEGGAPYETDGENGGETDETSGAKEISEKAYFIIAEGGVSGAKWISNGNHFVAEDNVTGRPSITLRRKFSFGKIEPSAILTVCGLGFFEAYINGERVGDGVFEPPFTDYCKRVILRSFPVADKLKTGENELEIILGDGWYSHTDLDTWGFFRAPWRDDVKAICKLTSGEETVCSDENFEWSFNETAKNSLRSGARIDFGTEKVYRKAVLTTPPGGELAYSTIPPMRECEKIKPIALRTTADNSIICDFGKNMTGYVSFNAKGARGTEVTVEYSDRINGDDLDNESNSMYVFRKDMPYQTDELILSGGNDFYKPKFAFNGFRYVKISLAEKAEIENITAYFTHTDLRKQTEFEISDELLNDLYKMSMQAILSNYVGIQTDCPHREKNGWTGDAQLSVEPCVYNFDMRGAYEKFIDDVKDAQRPSGQIPCIVPTCGWGYNWGSGPAWDVALFRAAKAEKFYYENSDAVKKALPVMKKYLAYLSAYEDADGLVSVGLGDWNFPKNIKFEVCPLALVSSGYYKLMCEIYVELSENADEAEEYRVKAKKLGDAIYKRFSGDKTLTGLCALWYFGIKDTEKEVKEYLENNGYSLHAGILGVKFLFALLGEKGLSEAAYKILSRTDYPSFGYWREHGQTALCEDFELTNSLNHHMFSPIAEYMLRYMAGLRLGEGKRSVTLKPNLPEKVKKAKFCVETAFGDFKAEIFRSGDELEIKTDVPCGLTAILEYKTTNERLKAGKTERILKA